MKLRAIDIPLIALGTVMVSGQWARVPNELPPDAEFVDFLRLPDDPDTLRFFYTHESFDEADTLEEAASEECEIEMAEEAETP